MFPPHHRYSSSFVVQSRLPLVHVQPGVQRRWNKSLQPCTLCSLPAQVREEVRIPYVQGVPPNGLSKDPKAPHTLGSWLFFFFPIHTSLWNHTRILSHTEKCKPLSWPVPANHTSRIIFMQSLYIHVFKNQQKAQAWCCRMTRPSSGGANSCGGSSFLQPEKSASSHPHHGLLQPLGRDVQLAFSSETCCWFLLAVTLQ